jgi:hypothetical protein
MIHMKKRFLPVIAFMLLSMISYAQDSTIVVSKNRYLQVGLGAGYMHTNMASIGQSLKSLGYKPLKEDYATLSLSGTYFMNRFLFHTEVGVILPSRVSQPGNQQTTFSGYTVGAGIGYAVVWTPKFRLYPYVGINAFNTTLQFTDKSSVADMDELVNGAHRNAKIRFANSSLDMGVRFERIIPLRSKKWDCPQTNRYLTLGAKVGYNWCPGEVKARYNGNVLTGAPSYNFQGPYMRLIVGVEKKIRQLNWKY